MSWKYDLIPRNNHWVFEYVFSAPTEFSFNFGNWYKLQETVEYPELIHIETFKVFKDKYERLHYFTFSVQERIEDFMEAVGITRKDIKTLTSHLKTRQEVTRLTYRDALGHQSFIYCLPFEKTQKRHHS